ncbi:oligosaccharide flippase family protein [Patescibacteria group bacterium]|nr:oligosaccharide flippase family protein [Patescibacteria group bacterium]
MIHWTKQQLYDLLRWSERYTKVNMVHFVGGNVWMNLGRVFSIGTGLVLTAAFANLLDPELFGVYKYVLAAASLVGAFTLNNMSGALMRAVAQGKQHVVPGVVRTMMLWSVPASIVSAGIGGYYLFHDNTTLGYGFLFIAVFNVISNGYGLAKSIIIAKGDFKNSFFLGLPRTIFPIIVIVAALFFTHSVIWILAAYFFSNAFASWIQYLWTLKRYGIRGSEHDVEETVRFGKHLSILGFFVLVSGQIDQLLLFHFSGGTQLAIYALALAPVLETRNLLDNFLSILFPRLAAKDKEEARRGLGLRLRQLTVAAILLTALYIVCIPFLFTFLFPKYMPAILVSQVLALGILFQPRGVIDTYIIAHGEVKRRYVAILSSQAVEFILFCTLIPLFGLWGAVWATVLSEAGAALALYIIYKTL